MIATIYFKSGRAEEIGSLTDSNIFEDLMATYQKAHEENGVHAYYWGKNIMIALHEVEEIRIK